MPAVREAVFDVGTTAPWRCIWRRPVRAWPCAILVVAAVVACEGGKSADSKGDASTADERVCQGNYFAADPMVKAEIADCTVATGDVIFTGNNLVSAELPKLTRVDGSFSVWGNPNVTRIAMPRLARVGGYFLVESNELLTSVDFPALTSVNERAIPHVADFAISGNPQLPTCQAHELRDQLLGRGFDGTIKIDGNLGTCPR